MKIAKKPKGVTPIKNIRRYCLWCCNNSMSEVKNCTCHSCALHPFRMGKKTIGGSVIKKIRQRCLDCNEGPRAINRCEHFNCPLFPYKSGHNPFHKSRINKRYPHWLTDKKV